MKQSTFDKLFTPVMLGGIGGIGGYILVSTLVAAIVGFVAVTLSSILYRTVATAS